MLESRIEKKIVKALREQGFESVKVGKTGWPDRFVIIGSGFHLWLEVKQPGGKLTKAQARRIPWMKDLGESVFVVESVEEALRLTVAFANRHRTLL